MSRLSVKRSYDAFSLHAGMHEREQKINCIASPNRVQFVNQLHSHSNKRLRNVDGNACSSCDENVQMEIKSPQLFSSVHPKSFTNRHSDSDSSHDDMTDAHTTTTNNNNNNNNNSNHIHSVSTNAGSVAALSHPNPHSHSHCHSRISAHDSASVAVKRRRTELSQHATVTTNLFTYDQVKKIVEDALQRQQEQLRQEYDARLNELLREQFDNFTIFNKDYISRALSKCESSYIG